jgi:hypothetical protein
MRAGRVLGAGGHAPRLREGTDYGTYSLARTQLFCEKCGHVMGFEIEKL